MDPPFRIQFQCPDKCIQSSNPRSHEHAAEQTLHKRRDETKKHGPITLRAYSLGELLEKQALVEARIDPLCICIKVSLYGLVSFATLHSGRNGAGVANWRRSCAAC